jgi:hypothetical protein
MEFAYELTDPTAQRRFHVSFVVQHVLLSQLLFLEGQGFLAGNTAHFHKTRESV